MIALSIMASVTRQSSFSRARAVLLTSLPQNEALDMMVGLARRTDNKARSPARWQAVHVMNILLPICLRQHEGLDTRKAILQVQPVGIAGADESPRSNPPAD